MVYLGCVLFIKFAVVHIHLIGVIMVVTQASLQEVIIKVIKSVDHLPKGCSLWQQSSSRGRRLIARLE